ncbi:MAG: SoxR reducing system RseC family protein [Pseudomonas sp.]
MHALPLSLLPLLGLFAAAMLAARLALGESLVILAGLGGFVLAGFAVRWHSQPAADDPALQPRLWRAMFAGPGGP